MKENPRVVHEKVEPDLTSITGAVEPRSIDGDVPLGITLRVAPLAFRVLGEDSPEPVPIRIPRRQRPVTVAIVAVGIRGFVRHVTRLQGSRGMHFDIFPMVSPADIRIVYI